MNSSQNYEKDLSFVIIGKNSESSIERLLDSVLACVPAHLSSEIIYVDSASTDKTVDIVSNYPATIIQLSADQPLCASAGRFTGSQYAMGKYIYFLDSDMELLSGWIERAMELLEKHTEIAAVSGVNIEVDPAAIRQGHNEIHHPCLSGDVQMDARCTGGAAIFRRSVLLSVGTWNPFIISEEEPELCFRIRHAGFYIAKVDCPDVYHHSSSSDRISTLFARRRRRLFFGCGQIIRYHLGTGLLIPFLRERGYAIVPALACLALVIAIFLSWFSGSIFWLVGLLGLFLLLFLADAIRSRSLYTASFHLVHRAVILEGTLKGLCMNARPWQEFPCNIQIWKFSN